MSDKLQMMGCKEPLGFKFDTIAVMAKLGSKSNQ